MTTRTTTNEAKRGYDWGRVLTLFRVVGSLGGIVLYTLFVVVGLVFVGALVLVDLADVLVNGRRRE